MPSLDDFEQYLPEPEPEPARTVAPALNGAIPEGGRNAALASMAGTMRRRGMSAETIALALKQENAQRCRPPLDDSEVEKIARSVGRYTPAPTRTQAARPATIADTSEIAPQLLAVDFPTLLRDGIPEPTILQRPYIYAGARILASGPAESAKSLYALWCCVCLTRRGVRCVYVSQENPLGEDARRVGRMRPAFENLVFFHDQGLDVADPAHVAALVDACAGAGFVVFDTLTAVWSGDEGDNAGYAAFDRDVLMRLVRETPGAAVMVLDHTGHPQAFVRRTGVSASRGASSKAQKADTVLVFHPEGESTFRIHHAKQRLGGRKEPERAFRVVDTDDDGLAVEEVELPSAVKVAELAERIVDVVDAAGALTTKALREAVGGGRAVTEEAFDLLKAEDPPRVRCTPETVTLESGRRQPAKVWRPVRGELA